MIYDHIEHLIEELTIALIYSNNDLLFHKVMVNCFENLNCEEEVANYFSMSNPSILRWKNGKNAPYPAIRKHVYKFLLKMIESKYLNKII